MRFLQLTKKFPYPPLDGESLLVSSFNKILKKQVDKIDLLSFNTIKHYFDISQFPEDQNHYNNIDEVFLDNSIKWYSALANIISSTPYHISRFIASDFKKTLKSILIQNQYDYILMESIFLVPYISLIRKYSKAKIILRAHNIEHEIWERITNNTSNRIKKAYLQYLTKQLKRYELNHIGDADIILTLTTRDLKKLRGYGIKTKAVVVPAGITGQPNQIEFDFKTSLKIAFLGSLDWMPNTDGLTWFIKNVLPIAIKQHPDTVLNIAGRNTPKSIFKLESKNIKVHGEVPDSKNFLLTYPIMIVPLFAGGGMRLKILEALALGRIVISTSIGIEGIDAIDQYHVLIANTAEEFQEKLQFCINNPIKLKRISVNAQKLFSEKYETSRIVKSFLSNLCTKTNVS